MITKKLPWYRSVFLQNFQAYFEIGMFLKREQFEQKLANLQIVGQ